MSAVDLFAGPGGWDLALLLLGIEPLGVEFDAVACETRREAGLTTLQADVSSLDPREFAAQLLVGSPPCPSFSRAGRQLGRFDLAMIVACMDLMAEGGDWSGATWHDERSRLTLEPLRWALAMRPRAIVLEQVPAVLPLWEHMAGILRARGYSVWTGKLRAETFGVPQTRERAFLLASVDRAVGAPVATHSRYHERDPGRLDLGVLPWVSMAEALGWGLEQRPAFTLPAAGSAGGGPRGMDGGSGQRRQVLEAVAGGRWSGERMPTETGAVRLEAEEAARLQTFPSWPWNRPAPTVGTTHGGVAGKQVDGHINLKLEEAAKLQTFPWAATRPATTVQGDPRLWPPGHKENASDPPGKYQQRRGERAYRMEDFEAACLQSFPDGYPWQGTKTKRFEQIGNAVPPLMALRVLEAVIA